MHRATTNQLTLSISRHFVPQFKAGQYVLDHLIIFNMRLSYCTRYSYRLDVCLSVCLSVCPSVLHTLVLCRNGSTCDGMARDLFYKK